MQKTQTTQKPKRRKYSIPLTWQSRVKMHSPSFRWIAYRQSLKANASRIAQADQAWVDMMIGDVIGSVHSLPRDLSRR